METLWKYNTLLITIITWLQCIGHVRAQQLQLDVGNSASIMEASKALADSCMAFYDGDKPGGIPGLLPPTAVGSWNWWQAGALWAEMIEYWYYTGDDRYNDIITQGILFQTGPYHNFEPLNQTRTEGNDDQAFWAFAAMTAAESRFPNPPPGNPSWLSLAQAVFNRQAARWDTEHCNGGLRWQFNSFNNGWMDKNTISNGCFFQLAARLARYTKNETYAEWAEKSYDWMVASPLISKTYEVFDSITFTEQACATTPGPIQWTYNIGTLISGVAFMYNYTNGNQTWKDRLEGYLGNTQRVFFPQQYAGGNIMVEYACETQDNCNKDQRSFKTYLSRWLAIAAQLAPFSSNQITPWLQQSAIAASRACTQTSAGLACGRKWYEDRDDGTRDVGNQMTALSIVQSNLIHQARGLYDIETGDSPSNPSAGTDSRIRALPALYTRKITSADKAGAWILTLLVLLCGGAGVLALVLDEYDVKDYTGFLGGSSKGIVKGIGKRFQLD